MLSELEKGVIKPLPHNALLLIAWRLRRVPETGSRLLLESLHRCANCHSLSGDGRTPGMDLGGPQNDKRLAGAVSARMLFHQSKLSSGKDSNSGELRMQSAAGAGSRPHNRVAVTARAVHPDRGL
jgi:hypothetical protein